MATPGPDSSSHASNRNWAALQSQSVAAASELDLVGKRQVLSAFINLCPKAELHVHIEGTLEKTMMLDIAERNGLPAPYPSLGDAHAAYKFTDLQSFLNLYYYGCSVLRTTTDFYDLAMAYFQKAAQENVLHVEFFFDPQTHLAYGIDFDVFMPGFLKAIKDAKELRPLGVNASMIMCFLRHLSEEDAFETLTKATPWLAHFVGVGLDSAELGNPPAKFKNVMERVRQLGLPVVAHAGEEGPAEFVWDALNLLQATRIDHGVHSLDDPVLMKHLAEKQVCLTVCPLSNLKLKVWDGILGPKLKELIVGTGLAITVNSDDPAYFDGYVNANYEWLTDACDLDLSQVAELAANSFKGAFIAQEEKDVYLEVIHKLAAEWTKLYNV